VSAITNYVNVHTLSRTAGQATLNLVAARPVQVPRDSWPLLNARTPDGRLVFKDVPARLIPVSVSRRATADEALPDQS